MTAEVDVVDLAGLLGLDERRLADEIRLARRDVVDQQAFGPAEVQIDRLPVAGGEGYSQHAATSLGAFCLSRET